MSLDGLEHTLRNLSQHARLVKDRGYRQVWRLEHGGRSYYLKFYRKQGGRDRFRRFFRGSPAMAEFTRLKRLAAAAIPSPRAVAVLMGFKIDAAVGDAVILEAIEPSIQLDHYFNDFELRAEPVPGRLNIATQVRDILKQLVKARLGHEDLHLGNFLLKTGKVYLLDGYAVRNGTLTYAHLLYLGHSVLRYATRTDLLRGWKELGPGGPLPLPSRAAAGLGGAVIVGRVVGENRYFGRFHWRQWSGSYFKRDKFPRRGSIASQLEITPSDWERELPQLFDRIERDELKILKRSKSGDVLAADVTLNGKTIDVIIKRPKKRYWYRYVNEIGRGSRAYRAWIKAWKIILRNLPTAWPLLYADKRQYGYVTDSIILFERVPGPTLARVDLDALPPQSRDTLMRRAGRILRAIDRMGLSHFDAKAPNWIVRMDEKLGPTPVMIDIDGIRDRRWIALGIRRLLKSMKENKTYTPADSLSLSQGYAPASKVQREGQKSAT